MPNFQQAKIYKIVCNITGLVYYGSTTQPTLAMRLSKHKYSYKCFVSGRGDYLTSFKILENNNYDMILVESCSYETKDQLHARERFFIENNPCVNMVIPNRNKKEYYKDNVDSIKKKNKQYYDANSKTVIEKQKVYNEINKDKISQQKKEYYNRKKQQLTVNETTPQTV
jgi:hypothetical protein